MAGCFWNAALHGLLVLITHRMLNNYWFRNVGKRLNSISQSYKRVYTIWIYGCSWKKRGILWSYFIHLLFTFLCDYLYIFLNVAFWKLKYLHYNRGIFPRFINISSFFYTLWSRQDACSFFFVQLHFFLEVQHTFCSGIWRLYLYTINGIHSQFSLVRQFSFHWSILSLYIDHLKFLNRSLLLQLFTLLGNLVSVACFLFYFLFLL